jgi:hypothetical protein
MLGIDAPESRQMCTSDKGTPYACGLESKTFMQDLIKNDPVTCFVCFLCRYTKQNAKRLIYFASLARSLHRTPLVVERDMRTSFRFLEMLSGNLGKSACVEEYEYS